MPTETPRLRLRRLELGDAAFICRLFNEPSWLENIGDRGVRTPQQAEAYIRDKAWLHYRQHGYGLEVIELKADGLAIGLCGLVRRDTLPGPDLGFALLPEHGGFGYAHEAAEAVMRGARSEHGIERLLAIVKPSNTRSLRVLERLGFRHEGGHRTPQGEDLMLFAAAARTPPPAR